MRNFKRPTSPTCFFKAALLVTLSSGLTLARAEGQAQKPDHLINERARLNDEVLRLSQPLTCKADTDCASLAMGSKPCGGPWKFVLYSKKNTKLSSLKKKLADYNKLDQKVNESQQLMSDCSVTLEPEPKCVNKMCVDAANVSASNTAPNTAAGFKDIKPVTH